MLRLKLAQSSAFSDVQLQDPDTGETVTAAIPVDESNLAHRAAALLREAMPNQSIQMLLRGRNTVGYSPDLAAS